MTNFEIDRSPSSGIVSFSGELLGEASSRADYKAFWTTITIYITDGGKFIVHVLGDTSIASKAKRHKLDELNSAKEVIAILCKHGEMSALALSAVSEAAKWDGDIDYALEDYTASRMKPIVID